MLAALCSSFGPDIFVKYCQGTIMTSIVDNLERGDQGADKEGGYESDSSRPGTPPPGTTADGQLLHQSAGWRTLETGCQ